MMSGLRITAAKVCTNCGSKPRERGELCYQCQIELKFSSSNWADARLLRQYRMERQKTRDEVARTAARYAALELEHNHLKQIADYQVARISHLA